MHELLVKKCTSRQHSGRKDVWFAVTMYENRCQGSLNCGGNNQTSGDFSLCSTIHVIVAYEPAVSVQSIASPALGRLSRPKMTRAKSTESIGKAKDLRSSMYSEQEFR